MYKDFYGLRANPFNVNPDPRYLFLTRHTEEALACLTYGIQSRKGFVLLTMDTTPGYTDTQPFPAARTVWTYRAIYQVNDARVGVWSQSVSLAVQA